MRRRVLRHLTLAVFPRGIHPALFWSLLAIAAALTAAGLWVPDPRGFYTNLSAEAWGTFATVVLIDSVLRRQREKEQAPMLRLAKAEAIALVHACRDLQRAVLGSAPSSSADETTPLSPQLGAPAIEAAMVIAPPEQEHSVMLHLRHIIRTADDVAARFARYLPDAELATMLRLRHAAQLALAHAGEGTHRLAQHLARVGVEACRLQSQLSGNSSSARAPAVGMSEGDDI